MSRIGKLPISIPKSVSVHFPEEHTLRVQGPLGTLSQSIAPSIAVDLTPDAISLTRKSNQKLHKAFHGLYRSLIHNMVVGVTTGYAKTMQLIGVGYRVSLHGDNTLELKLGYAHPIYFVLPPEVTAKVELLRGGPPSIHLKSIDKQLLGQVAARIKALRKPDPYKGKGVIIQGQPIRRKVGKKVGK